VSLDLACRFAGVPAAAGWAGSEGGGDSDAHRRGNPAPTCPVHRRPFRDDTGLDRRRGAGDAREFALLRLLAEHPRRVFPREELFERIWGTYGDQGTVWVHIRRLREKIERDPAQPELITTVRGVGYRFEARPDDRA
jgi:hypothetical protein